MLPRFFIHSAVTTDKEIVIDDRAILKQIRTVLRMKKNDSIIIFDNSGYEYEVEIISFNDTSLSTKIIEKRSGGSESKYRVVLVSALLKNDKFEYVLQKCTEIGVQRFIPILTKNCVSLDISTNKMKRYEKIVIEATEQCGGALVPKIDSVVSFSQVLKNLPKDAKKFIASVDEKKNNFCDYLQKCPMKSDCEFFVFVGPEGGFTQTEVDFAKKYGVVAVSLGRRVLRAETASIVFPATILI